MSPPVHAASSRLPRGVWMLGFVSLFMDISSEMIHSLLPVFLVTTLGASALALGFIEGVAEAATAFVKFFSGWWSDRWRRRKPLAVLGYGLAALTKPMFPLADSITMVFAARFTDRIGKGIRGAPRDAMLAELTPPELRGAAYGLRQSLDTVGAVAGPLLAVALMFALASDIRAVYWFATVPAFISVAILMIGVRETATADPAAAANKVTLAALRRFPRVFWLLMAVLVPFTLARFSEAFLVLRGESLGLTTALLPLVMVAMSVAYAASAYPAGRLSDRMPRTRLLALGCALMVAADLCLALGDGLIWLFGGAVLWGLHMGFSEGLIAALVSDYAPPALLGTAFGVMHCLRGVLLLIASTLAGALWSWSGPALTFMAGAVFSGLALAVLQFLPHPSKP